MDGTQIEKKRVMLVDDAMLARRVVKNMLSRATQLEVVAEAVNGQDALDQLDTAMPDIILLDIEMPIMDGLEFLRHARLRSKAKVVVLSSVATTGSRKAAQARLLGADAVIAKPSGAISLDLDALRGNLVLRTIHSLLGIEQ